MDDQANRLRELVSQGSTPPSTDHRPGPRLIMVTGGRKGVGTTTVAVNLAIALMRKRRRTVLVDADPHHGHAARLCRVEAAHKPADSLQSRQTVLQLLRPGPGGLQVLPAAGALLNFSQASSAGHQWLVGQLQGLASQADWVVLDAGNGLNPQTDCVGQAADALLVITTPEVAAVMDAYASIKALAADRKSPPVYTLVNVASSRSAARQVHLRLAQACWRFLAVRVEGVGYVAEDPAVAAAGKAGAPFLLTSPRSRPARQIRRTARRLARPLKQCALTV
jgi:flagellar biosynthesis protein FlhG